MVEINHVEVVRTLYGHSSDVTCIEFQQNILATCSSDKTLRLWGYDQVPADMWELPHSPLLGHKYSVHACCFSPTEPLLVSCSTDGNIFFWNIQNGEIEATLKHPSGLGVRTCSFSPNGVLLATAGEDDSVIIWDVNTRSLIRCLEGHEATISACTFSPDSAYIVSGSSNCDLALWDARYGDGHWLCRTLEAHDLGVSYASFSQTFVLTNDDKSTPETTYLLASCGNDSIVRLWHVKTGASYALNQYQELRGHSANVWCCRFSSDGQLLASSAGDKSVIIWDPLQGAILQKLERHSRYVTCCAFSVDGQFLASGSNDKTVIIWKLFKNEKGASVSVGNYQQVYPVTSIPKQKKLTIPNKDPAAPDEYYCPITQEIMKDPVILSDGFTYERSAISSWFQSGKDTSPMTNERLTHMQLTSNLVLRTLIKRYMENKDMKQSDCS